MIPLSDENPTLHTPWMTWLLIGTTVAVWLVVQGAGLSEAFPTSVCNLGLVPGELTGQARVGTGVPLGDGLACIVDREPINRFTPVISMFLHGGWGHLLGNMLFFWVFGNNIEDSMGPGRFLLFYLICGLVAAGAHVLVEPASPVPTVGASGAISGIMGAYLVLYPRVRVFCIVPIGFIPMSIALPAWTMLIYWMVLQGIGGLTGLLSEERGGVAFWAHLGGFLAGVILVKLLARPKDVQAHRRGHWEPRRVAARW